MGPMGAVSKVACIHADAGRDHPPPGRGFLPPAVSPDPGAITAILARAHVLSATGGDDPVAPDMSIVTRFTVESRMREIRT